MIPYIFPKHILNICLLSTVFWKDENKEKEAGNGPFLKKKKKLGMRGTFVTYILIHKIKSDSDTRR